MKTKIDITTWERKEYWNWFQEFEEPFHGSATDIDCTGLYAYAKQNNISFYLLYLHAILKAVNSVEELKYRWEDGNIVKYDIIHAGPTVGRDDKSFGIAFINYFNDFDIFVQKAKEEISRVQKGSGLMISENAKRLDLIHFSSIPWQPLTVLSHARKFSVKDSVPKISVAKTYNKNSRLFLPISIHVHHGFVDGWHVCEFFRILKTLIK